MASIRPLAAGIFVLIAGLAATADRPSARQARARPQPIARLEPAPVMQFPAATDSNSPAYWLLHRGVRKLVVINSSPDPVISFGPDLNALRTTLPTRYKNEINGERWIEAVIPDEAGRLYGFYHNEPAGVCDTKTAPRIGAARSTNGGRTWTDLGIIIEAPPGGPDCDSPNHYFAGGVGDFSVILNQTGTDLYFLFSNYGPAREQQGVAAARMRWADRDEPQGRVAIWEAGVWRDPVRTEEGWIYPPGTPIFPAAVSWHDPRGGVDAFWGPSVHWNTALERYVVLLNRANDSTWNQEGIYISATRTIEDPSTWWAPRKLLDGGTWYPQVIGLEPGTGTDKLAGERARFFMGGTSGYEIVFEPPNGFAQQR